MWYMSHILESRLLADVVASGNNFASHGKRESCRRELRREMESERERGEIHTQTVREGKSDKARK